MRVRVYTLLAALVFITLSGGLVMVWYTYRMEGLMRHLIDKNMAGIQVAEGLASALINQESYASYFFQDGDEVWLRQLAGYRKAFHNRFIEARSLAEAQVEKNLLSRIEAEYIKYITLKDQVIDFYKSGGREAGDKLHKQARHQFFIVVALCEQYTEFHTRKTSELKTMSYAQAKKLRVVAGTAILIVLFLAVLLAFVLVNDILEPLRRLAREADRRASSSRPTDEVKALSRSVRGLIEDMDHTQTELEKSREHLLQAEKMVLVGQLAAGMAHSIRNPLTSVKMRLFSLGRTLHLTSHQSEDFQVISEEILHIDNIVQSFLEFSRPPKLKMQKVSPSQVVDLVLRLMEHRLKSYHVEVKVDGKRPLPQIQADPERLKEALVNIIVNACEAMAGSGSIIIREEERTEPQLGSAVAIHLTDTGPGIPDAIQEKIFSPFFTTKEEGSGLGLSIAARIVDEHGGRIDLKSKQGQGSTFSIVLPTKPVENRGAKD